jgi:aerobic-type carbon monoxide dehydrogenase small subunit (CoxS/CutS family)
MTGRGSGGPRSAGPPPSSEPTRRHTITVTVNGEIVTAEVESRLLLTDFLRHRLRLTGTHVGCEQGACGACTIQLDGRAVRSCLMLAVQADGREVRTIEGLPGSVTGAGVEVGVDGPTGELSAVQQAFADQHGLQCGFCTPGFVMSIQALIDGGGPVTEAEVDECVDSSYCRCTGYVNIRRAARQALALPPSPGPGPGPEATHG